MGTLDRIRTDVVGSLLRPARWKEARARLDAGTLSPEEFSQIEMACVREHVALEQFFRTDLRHEMLYERTEAARVVIADEGRELQRRLRTTLIKGISAEQLG